MKTKLTYAIEELIYVYNDLGPLGVSHMLFDVVSKLEPGDRDACTVAILNHMFDCGADSMRIIIVSAINRML